MTEVNETYGCILSKFYIKPQQRIRHKIGHSVVSYRNSTSNHNRRLCLSRMSPVVSYRNSTSNHNASMPSSSGPSLYLIEILHQTTTRHPGSIPVVGCILSKFYIKPQCSRASIFQRCCCILSKFYIKPQRAAPSLSWFSRCILSKFYIKPQQSGTKIEIIHSCILSKFYIKPQQLNWEKEVPVVVSYRNSTSNHNHVKALLSGTSVVSYRNSTSNHNASPPII